MVLSAIFSPGTVWHHHSSVSAMFLHVDGVRLVIQTGWRIRMVQISGCAGKSLEGGCERIFSMCDQLAFQIYIYIYIYMYVYSLALS